MGYAENIATGVLHLLIDEM